MISKNVKIKMNKKDNCKTIKKGGFIWDYAGHFYHFKDENMKNDFIEKIKMQNLVFQKKNTKVLYKNKKLRSL